MGEYDRVKEVAYLDVENTERYRRIMRFCYLQNLTVRAALYRNEILVGVQEAGLPDYREDQLEADLNYLVANGNLTQRQEMSQARSIEEFKNKHFRYQITAASIAIEQLMGHLPQEAAQSGEMNAHLFERLLALLQPLPQLAGEQLGDQWASLVSLFQEIQQAAALYVNYLTSVKVEQMMQTSAFLAYKAEFIHYLQIFIRKLQVSANEIQALLATVPESVLTQVAEEQIKLKQSQPNFEQADQGEIQATVRGQWQALRQWFLDSSMRQSEYRNLIQQTTNALDRVTRVIQAMTANRQQQRSRTRDYRQLVSWFEAITQQPVGQGEQLRQANQMAAALFGFAQPKHIQAEPLDFGDPMADLWAEPVPTMPLTSKSRQGRERVAVKPFTRDLEAEKRAQAVHLEQQAAYRALWQRYLEGGQLKLSAHKVLPKALRHDLLRYLSLALVSEAHEVRTSFGVLLRVSVAKNDRVTLQFEDGTLEMPDVVYQVVEVTTHD